MEHISSPAIATHGRMLSSACGSGTVADNKQQQQQAAATAQSAKITLPSFNQNKNHVRPNASVPTPVASTLAPTSAVSSQHTENLAKHRGPAAVAATGKTGILDDADDALDALLSGSRSSQQKPIAAAAAVNTPAAAGRQTHQVNMPAVMANSTSSRLPAATPHITNKSHEPATSANATQASKSATAKPGGKQSLEDWLDSM